MKTRRLVFLALLFAQALFGQTNATLSLQLYAGLTISGTLGQSYAVQYSSSLGTNVNWQTLTNIVLTNNPFLWVDTSTPAVAGRYFRVVASTFTNEAAPSGMVLIPAGSFVMGDNLDGESDAPTNLAYINAIYMDSTLVSYSLWQSVYQWATGKGYQFDNPGLGKASNQPVQSIDWYDAIKWCNARSRMEGVTPVYYTDAGLTQVYTNEVVAPYANWSANGYRLPTEAEWEKAARGGLVGNRFPRGNTIAESQANYYSDPADYAYDLGPAGYPLAFGDGIGVCTSPVENFTPNAYGLYDMAGNTAEWCWDWYGPYPAGVQTNPHGASAGSYRVLRGGSWVLSAYDCRVANRSYYYPGLGENVYGFRTVMTVSQ